MVFQTRDLLALTAFVAIFFALSRLVPLHDSPVLLRLHGYACISLWSITIPLAALASWDAKARWECLHSPGKLIVLIQVCVLLIRIASESYWLWLPGVSPADRLPNYACSVALEPMIPAGVAVSAWITLRVSGVRHAEEDWRGSVGRVTAVLWVLLALAESVRFLPDVFQV